MNRKVYRLLTYSFLIAGIGLLIAFFLEYALSNGYMQLPAYSIYFTIRKVLIIIPVLCFFVSLILLVISVIKDLIN